MRKRALLGMRACVCVSLLLASSACGSSKLSAAETAAYIHAHTSKKNSTRCVKSSGGWDYACTLKTPGVPTVTVQVDVNGRGITQQTAP
jgi:hypothetical protein